MFSSTTIASSITNPVATVSAISDRLLRLNPSRYIAANVPISETGTAITGMSVARTLRKKTNTTSVTRMTEMTSVRSTSCSDSRIVVLRSSTTEASTAAGMAAPSSGRSARTRSTVPMMLAPGWRKITTTTAGILFITPSLRTSSTESSTSASADSVTGAPF